MKSSNQSHEEQPGGAPVGWGVGACEELDTTNYQEKEYHMHYFPQRR